MESLPANLDAEADFLGCCIISPAILDECPGITGYDFFSAEHQAVFEAIQAARAKGIEVTAITVIDELARAGRERIFLKEPSGVLMEMAGKASLVTAAPHLAKLIKRDSLLRKVVLLCSETIERARGRHHEAGELISSTVQQLLDLGTDSQDQPVRLGDGMGGVLDTLDAKAKEPAKHSVTTGIRKFDNLIGGFRAPQLVTVAARPGVGKTALAVTVGLHNAKLGIPVLLFSMEMSFQEMAERVLSNVSRVPGHDLSSGRVTYDTYKGVMAAARRLTDVPLWIDDRMRTVGQIAAIARAWRNRLKSDRGLVVIDYLGLIRPSGGAETRALEVGRMAWAAKALAKDLSLPVVLVSQLNRDSERERRKPVLSDLRDSGEIEQHSDMVIFPYREPLADGRIPDDSAPASLIVAKHRGGPTGEIDCYWHAPTMTFFDCAEECDQ